MNETVVTSKGTTTIPDSIRRELGIRPGTILDWSIRDGALVASKKTDARNALQRHIRRYAGSWSGKVSGKELLKRTRP